MVEEDARDLVRCREAARADLMRARHRLSKLLLRHGIVYCGGRPWIGVHQRWLRTLPSLRFDDLPGTRAAFAEALDAVLASTARRDRLDEQIEAMAALPQWAPVVSRRLGMSAVRRSVGRVPGGEDLLATTVTSVSWRAAMNAPRDQSNSDVATELSCQRGGVCAVVIHVMPTHLRR